jgi:HK97 family phage major capsid protein
MKTKFDLQEDKTHKLKSMEDILSASKGEQRAMSKDETVRFDTLKKDVEFLDSQLDSMKATEEREAYVSTEIAKSRVPEARKVSPSAPSAEIPETRNDNHVEFITSGSLKAFPDTVEGRKSAHDAGRWFAGNVLGHARSARYCRDNGIELRTNLSEGTTTAGGYLVPTLLEGPIIKIRNQYGVMPSQVKVRPMANDTLNVPNQTTAIAAGVIAEGSSISVSQQVFAQLQLVAQKVAVITEYSTELSEDSIVNLGDEVAFEHGYALAKFFDDAWWNGTGSATYANIVGCGYNIVNTATENLVSAAAGHVSFAKVTAADINSVLGSLPAYAVTDAKIYCSNYVYFNVFLRLAAAAGGNSVLSLSQTLGKNWLGIPIVLSEVLPGQSANATVSQPVFYYGNADQAMCVGERRGITTAVSKDVFFVSDLVAVRSTQRLAMKVKNPGTSSVFGSMVTLTTAAS